MADIFISYNREDQAVADLFVKGLEAAGLSVWWDAHLRAGEAYDEITEDAIREAKAVVVLWSRKSVASRWVRAEAALAQKCGTFVPCMIEPCERPIMFELTQTDDLSHWRGDQDDPAWKQFCAHVKTLVGKERGSSARAAMPGGDPAPSSEQSRPQPSGPNWNRKGAIALAVAIGLAVVIGAAMWLLRLPVEEQSAENLSIALQRIDRDKSIAVKPFTNISEDGEDTWFSAALTGEITNALGRIPDVIVAQQGDVAAISEKTSAEVARELGVANVLEGTVLQTGDKLRVSVSLANAEGRQIWAETYDRPATDLIQIHEEIAAEVAEALGSLLDPEKLADFVNLGTKSFEAYQHIARIPEQAFLNWDDFNLALDAYRKAYEADPAFARAHLGAALLYLNTISPDTMDRWSDKSDAIEERWPAFLEELKQGRKLARREEDLAYGRFLHAIGFGNIRAMRAALIDQLTANPTLSGPIWGLVHVNNMVGKSEENGPLVEAYLRLEPDQLGRAVHLAWESGMREKAIELGEQILAESSSEYDLHQAFNAFTYMGELDRAAAALSKHNAMTDDAAHAAETSAYLACARGDRKPLLAVVEKADSESQPYYNNMMLGNTEEANASLKQYDRARPPYPLIWQLYSGIIDVTEFPNLRNLIERDGLRPTKMRLVAYCPT